jgi:hypothetical protein
LMPGHWPPLPNGSYIRNESALDKHSYGSELNFY